VRCGAAGCREAGTTLRTPQAPTSAAPLAGKPAAARPRPGTRSADA